MAVDKSDDILELEINVTGSEEAQQKIDKFVAAGKKAVDAVNKVQKKTGTTAQDTSKDILALQKEISTLTSKYVQLAKAKNIGDIGDKNLKDAANTVTSLTEKLNRLQQIEAQFSAGFGRGTARLQKQLRDEVKQIGSDITAVTQQYLQAKQLVAVASLTPTANPPKFINASRVDRRYELLQSRANVIDAQLATVRNAGLRDTRMADIANRAEAARQSVKQLTREIDRLEQEANASAGDQTILSKMDKEAEALAAQLRVARREYFRLRAETKDFGPIIRTPGSVVGSRGGGGGGRGGGPDPLRAGANYGGQALAAFGIGGFAAGLGPVAGIGAAIIGLERFIHFSDIMLKKASEVVRVNRLLASSATEAGLSYSELADKNLKFANTLGVNIVRAGEISARIAQLSARTARPENIDKLFTAFGDLSAARGLDANELQTIVQQVITGQDEAYKKLGLQNPSILYKEFADKTGRSAADLSSLERARVVEQETVKKADLFKGAADARLKTLDGRVAKLYTSIENVQYSISSAFANNPTVIKAIDTITLSLSNLNKGLTDLNNLSKTGALKGIALDAAIAKQSQSFLGYALESQFSTLFKGDSIYQVGSVLAGKTLEPNTSSFFNYQSTSADTIRQQLNANKLQEAQQKIVAEQEKAELARRDAEDKARAEDQRLQQYYRERLSDPRRTQGELRAIIDRFSNNGGVFNQDSGLTTDSQRTLKLDAEKALSSDIAGKFALALQKPNVKLQELRQSINEIKLNSDIFPEEKTRLLQNYEQAIDGIKNKVDSLKTSFVDFLAGIRVENNPFSQILADIAKAETEANKFKGLGPGVVDFIKTEKIADANRRLEEQRFRNFDESLKLRQEARRLEDTLFTQRDAFDRRLATVEEGVRFGISNFELSRRADEASFYVNGYNAYNPKSFLEERLGRQGIDQLSRGFGAGQGPYQDYIQTSLQIQDALEQLKILDSINLQGTGIYGQEAIAKQFLNFAPSIAQLVPRLTSFGQGKEDSILLLEKRAQAQRVLRDANQAKFKDFIETQRFLNLNREDLDLRIAGIKQSGLTDFKKIEEYLNITSELGTGELTANQRQLRIQALNAKATFKDQEEKVERERQAKFAKLVDTLTAQIEGAGLKMDIGEESILDINLNVPVGTSVTSQNTRPNSSNVAVKYG